MHRNAGRSVIVLLLVVSVACLRGAAPDPDAERRAREAVLSRLASYAAAARAVDADASAAFFTARGTLFEPGIPPIVTPDSIRAFIKSFPGVIVDSAMARADTVQVYGNSAFVWGTYYERLRFAGQPQSAQWGRFVMEWRLEADSTWRIERYYRVPLPAAWSEP